MKLRRVFYDNYGLRIGAAVTLILVGILVAILVGIVGCRQLDHSMSKNSCYGWGEATGREVQFVDYHYFSYQCLVHIDDGRWVDVSNVVAIEGEGGRLKLDIQGEN